MMRFKIFDTFAKEPFQGNPTGVVYGDETLDKAMMQKMANELSLPHTLFLLPSEDSSILFNSLVFTPFQEVAICSQGIIAGVFAFLDDEIIPDGTHTIGTALGKKEVFIATINERIKYSTVFTSLGRPTVEKLSDNQRARLVKLIDNRGLLDFKGNFVVLGNKKRLVINVPYDLLKELAFISSKIMNVCQDLGIAGIAFFSKDQSTDLVHSRYFTTLLNGREDAVTGIAAGSILAACLENKLIEEQEDITVHQGGFTTREGYLYPKYRDNQIFVGGRASKAAEGKLFNI
ncbi:MAG: PhzF family phenazine biosynthesis isomerase [Candidatus Heimdallarchaeota archaeon]|nr:PhzF family phenazine biosynthesis isomerase [Candidatus Heimdallarchaeota archaeon]